MTGKEKNKDEKGRRGERKEKEKGRRGERKKKQKVNQSVQRVIKGRWVDPLTGLELIT